jgi:hypothetical protein
MTLTLLILLVWTFRKSLRTDLRELVQWLTFRTNVV